MAKGDRPDPNAPSRESSTHRISVPEPDHVGLPKSRRSFVVPLIIAIVVFIGIIVIRVFLS